ncbi:hypothetical protein [Marivirga sp.]|uniref:hypothetical protein n=1 Tax=Marivirga sp. TaxID=2018662 RepID=UPI002D8007F3|nr:hypothetical protein [Marivirga sp.]HET8859316.1 hypothetical protein [Marivirga sp.]
MKKIILLIAVVIIGLIFYSLFSVENINSLNGDFKELAFNRNENNTGPVKRVYAFSIEDTLWAEMKKHADLLPHTKYGSTEVFYFLENQISDKEVKVTLKGINSDFQKVCIGYSMKDGQSRLNFKKYPFQKL